MNMSSSDDRTQEFLSLARSLPSNGGYSNSSHRFASATTTASSAATTTTSGTTNDNKQAYAELRSFHQQAAGISRDIASTSALLQELTNLVKHKSLFQDDNANVNALVVRIKSNIENLNARLETADRTIQQQKRALGKNSQAGQEAANLVSGLQEVFAEAASDFKKVLQERTENLKETENIQRQIYTDQDMDEIPDMSRPTLSARPVYGVDAFPALDLTSALTAAGNNLETPTSLPRPHGIMSGTAGSAAAVIGSNNHNSLRHQYSGQYSAISSGNSALLTPLDIQRLEQEQGDSQMMQLIPDQDYLQQRADAMSTVESQIVELGTIFNKLAGLVHEHRDMVQRVEDNVEEANASIFQSMNALTDTLENLRTNRALMLRVFSIFVVFIIFFIIFFA